MSDIPVRLVWTRAVACLADAVSRDIVRLRAAGPQA